MDDVTTNISWMTTTNSSMTTINSSMMTTNSSVTTTNNSMMTTNSSTMTKNSSQVPQLLALLFINVIPGLVAHAIVLTVMRKDLNRKLCLAKRLLLGMCCADITGIVVVFVKHLLNVVVSKPWFSLCAGAAVSISFVALLSAILATTMGIERCIALRAPFWYKANFDSWKMAVPIILVIVLAFLISLLPVTSLGTVFEIKPNTTDAMCSSFPSQRITVGMQGVFPMVFAGFGGLMILVNLSSNGLVIKTLHDMRIRVKNVTFDSQGQNKSLIEHELTKMLLLLSVCFVVCWGPMYMMLILIQMGVSISTSVISASYGLAGFNFAIDPIIYITMIKTYQKRVRNLCSCCRTAILPVDGVNINTDIQLA